MKFCQLKDLQPFNTYQVLAIHRNFYDLLESVKIEQLTEHILYLGGLTYKPLKYNEYGVLCFYPNIASFEILGGSSGRAVWGPYDHFLDIDINMDTYVGHRGPMLLVNEHTDFKLLLDFLNTDQSYQYSKNIDNGVFVEDDIDDQEKAWKIKTGMPLPKIKK